MKKLALFALAFVAALAAPRADAQFSLIPYAGYNLEDGFGLLVGIGTEFVAPFELSNLDLAIRPSAEYHFVDDSALAGFGSFSYFQINGDVLARFSGSPSVAPYAGAGLALGISSVEFDNPFGGGSTSESNTEIGINIFGGAEFPGLLGFGTPFAQGRFTLVDPTDQISILAGVSIPLGN
jgi:opacity protein-like surface antigen